jgi:hypothetical protein
MDLSHSLRDLDKHAAEFNFPVLDNAYVDLAAMRLTAYKASNKWVILFEILGFSNQEGAFVNDLYAYGPCLDKEGLINSRTVLSSSTARPLSDPERGEWLANWENWEVVVKGDIFKFTPQPFEYKEFHIEIPVNGGQGTLSEANLLRFLVGKLGAATFFMTDDELLSELSGCHPVFKLIQTDAWQHPDIAGGEKPSESISLRSLLEALKAGNPNLFKPGQINTHWWLWTLDKSQ